MKRAFTLVELLVSMSIITLLIGILTPAFVHVKRSAEGVACLGNLKQLGLAVVIYSGDYDDLMPYGPGPITKFLAKEGSPLGGDPYGELIQQLPDARSLLLPYGPVSPLWHCPDDRISPVFAVDGNTSWFGQTGASYSYDDYDAFSGLALDQVPSPSSRLLIRDVEGFHGSGEVGPGDLYNCLLFDGHAVCAPLSEKNEFENHLYWF